MTMTRRDVIAATAGLAAVAVAPNTTSAAVPLPSEHALTRIAFGSCADQEKEQPIWDKVLEARPELFLFLGDNIYADTRDINVMREKYGKLAAKPGFQKLRETTPILAVWDDHDFGENDAGGEYPLKSESKQTFLEFWNEPKSSPRWTRNGIYTSHVFGPAGRRVQIILPDLRTNRTAINTIDMGGKDYETWAKERHAAGLSIPGPYQRNPDPKATMLGEPQWAWLEEQFKVPADVRIFGSSLQVLADFPGWEAWINYARDHQRLIDLIRRTRASGMVFLSGDTHYAEISKIDLNTPYPLWDITSSGITEVWPVLPPNDNRVGEAVREPNFGLINIDWNGADTVVTLEVRDQLGATRINQRIALKELRTT